MHRGEIKPTEAESEAKRLGLGTLASEPEPADYDPMREPHWTLSMAVAWVAYREAHAVRNWWDEYRSQFTYWNFREWRETPEGPVHQGWFLERRCKATLRRLQMVGGPREQASISETINALQGALRDGTLEAVGVDKETGLRVPIPAAQWHDPQWWLENTAEETWRGSTPSNARALYRDVTVSGEAVRELWPPVSPSQAELPALMKPEGPGYMPLYCAAQWIATRGGSFNFDPSDESVWKPAYAELLARIASEEIKVIGTSNGERQPVPGYHFAGCRVDYPFADSPFELLLSEELYLWSSIYLDEEHWRKGHGDCLEDRRGPQWERLMVLKSDIAKVWPFQAARTGAPGRPSSMHLIEAEFEARCKREEVAASLAEESRNLANWLRSEHPSAPRLTEKTIQNRLRETYRQHKRARN